MSDEDFLLELYSSIRSSLKKIINEEENIEDVKFWSIDIIERVQHICRVKKRIIKKKGVKSNENKSNSN